MAIPIDPMSANSEWKFINPPCSISDKDQKQVLFRDAYTLYRLLKNNSIQSEEAEFVSDVAKKSFYFRSGSEQKIPITNISINDLKDIECIDSTYHLTIRPTKQGQAPVREVEMDAMDIDEPVDDLCYSKLKESLETERDNDRFQESLTKFVENDFFVDEELASCVELRGEVLVNEFLLQTDESPSSALSCLTFLSTYFSFTRDPNNALFRKYAPLCLNKIKNSEKSDSSLRRGLRDLIGYLKKADTLLPSIQEIIESNDPKRIEQSAELFGNNLSEQSLPLVENLATNSGWLYDRKVNFILKNEADFFLKISTLKPLLTEHLGDVKGFTPHVPEGKFVGFKSGRSSGLLGLCESLHKCNLRGEFFVTEEDAVSFYKNSGYLILVTREGYHESLRTKLKGISPRWIAKIFLDSSAKNDLQKMLSSKETTKVHNKLENEGFRKISLELLGIYRELLLSKAGENILYALIDHDSTPGPFATVKEMDELRALEPFTTPQCREAGKELLQSLKNPQHVERLLVCTDSEFTELEVLQCAFALGIPIADWKQVKAGHGKTPGGFHRATLWDHHVYVITGQERLGFGLRTDLPFDFGNNAANEFRKILRLAAIFHDSGKLVYRDGSPQFDRTDHVKRSSEVARKHLTEHKNLFSLTDDQITLITALILNNDLFGAYCKGNLSLGELQTRIGNSYTDISALVSRKLYHQLLFILYIADASTLSQVREDDKFIKALSSFKKTTDPLDTLFIQKLPRRA